MIKLEWKHWFWAGWESGSGCVGLSAQHTSNIQQLKIPGLFQKIHTVVSVFCSGQGLAFCMEVPMRLGPWTPSTGILGSALSSYAIGSYILRYSVG